MKKIISSSVATLLLLFFFMLETIAQNGSIKGVVKVKGQTETIVGANVFIDGTTNGNSSDLDGNYEIKDLKPGNYKIVASFISFKTENFENIQVKAGQATILNIEMVDETTLLNTVVIKGALEREKENVLLMEQRKATTISQSIGAQELSRKGVSDVASAVSKVSGISKQEGSNNVFVRGLGDRYNSTQLNGLPVPSNNPEKKNIELDIFSTDIVGFIKIDKVYGNDIYGDFAGGNVNIQSKEFNGDPFIQVNLGSGYNLNSSIPKAFLIKNGPGYFGNHDINKPNTITKFAFDSPYKTASLMPYKTDFSISGGRSFSIGENKTFSLFATYNFGNDFSYKEGITLGALNSQGIPHKDLKFENYSYQTNSTAMVNMSFKLKNSQKISYNFMFINSSDNSNENYFGTVIDIANENNGYLARKIYENNCVLVNQLTGFHKISKSLDFDWASSYNTIVSDAPDRIWNTFVQQPNGDYLLGQNQITDNHRYFHLLTENEFALNGAMHYKFWKDSNDNHKIKLTLGGSTRYKMRDFSATQYNFRIPTSQRNTVVDPTNLEAFFNQENLDNGFFRIETFRGNQYVDNALDPQIYNGVQIINAAFLTAEYKISPKFTALVGLRAESIYQEVGWNTQLDPNDKTDILEISELLPSLTTKYEISEKQNLRFGASKTYTLPQFKERALFIYEEVTQVKLGNPDLYQSDNYNVDLKWELFPKPSEIIAIGVFGKYIMNPINEVAISSATGDISFINTGDWGYVSGVELEFRKDIFHSKKQNFKIQSGLNISYMKTEQELNPEKIIEETIYMANFTHEKAKFTGASDLLMNADVSFQKSWKENKNKIIGTIAYSFVSEKIYALGTNNRGNIIESPVSTLDFILKTEFNKLSFGLGIKNILNTPIERYQANKDKDYVIHSYKRGMNLGFSIGYKF